MENLELVKKLVEKGYSLDIIALEMNTTVDALKKALDEEMKKELIKEAIKKDEEKKTVEKKAPKKSSKKTKPSRLQKLRDKYFEIYDRKIETVKRVFGLTQEQYDFAEEQIAAIEEIASNSDFTNNSTKPEIVKSISEKYDKISKYQLSSYQVSRIWKVYSIKEIASMDRIKYQKKDLTRQMIDAVDYEVGEIDELDKLEILERRINSEMQRINYIQGSSVSGKVSRKVQELRKVARANELRTNISDNVRFITEGILNGDLDPEDGNSKLAEEAHRLYEESDKSKFALTEEKQKDRIITQIRTLISDNVDLFQVQDANKSFNVLRQLDTMNGDTAYHTIVKNLIDTKRFQDAKDLSTYAQRNGLLENSDPKFMRNQILFAEIGEEVMKAIKAEPADYETEEELFETINQGIIKNKLNLSNIPLGKNAQGNKNISLRDCWEEQRTR